MNGEITGENQPPGLYHMLHEQPEMLALQVLLVDSRSSDAPWPQTLDFVFYARDASSETGHVAQPSPSRLEKLARVDRAYFALAPPVTSRSSDGHRRWTLSSIHGQAAPLH